MNSQSVGYVCTQTTKLYLLDLGRLVELGVLIQVPLRVLSAFPRVGLGPDLAHGYSQLGVGLNGDAVKIHRIWRNKTIASSQFSNYNFTAILD